MRLLLKKTAPFLVLTTLILTNVVVPVFVNNAAADVGCTTGSPGCDPGTSAAPSGGYEPLVQLYDKDGEKIPTDLSGYIIGVFFLAIGLSSVLAVVVIIYGGILYMSSDAYFQKSEGKAIIQRTLWGIVIIILSYLILQTINSNLLKIGGIF